MLLPRGRCGSSPMRRWGAALMTVLVLLFAWPAGVWADPLGSPFGRHLPGAPGAPVPPQPWDRGGDDTARRRDWQEQQQREARERNERRDQDGRWGREHEDRWDDGRGWGWDRGWDRRPDPWVRPAPPVVVVPPPPPRRYVHPRPRYGVVVPVLPWAATAIVVGTATYWYCDGVYYRRLPADAGYQVVDGPTEAGDGRIVDERLYVYPRKGQSPQQQASDEYDCHRWAVGQTGFDPTLEGAWDLQNLDRRDDYRRAQSACLDGRGYTVK